MYLGKFKKHVVHCSHLKTSPCHALSKSTSPMLSASTTSTWTSAGNCWCCCCLLFEGCVSRGIQGIPEDGNIWIKNYSCCNQEFLYQLYTQFNLYKQKLVDRNIVYTGYDFKRSRSNRHTHKHHLVTMVGFRVALCSKLVAVSAAVCVPVLNL